MFIRFLTFYIIFISHNTYSSLFAMTKITQENLVHFGKSALFLHTTLYIRVGIWSQIYLLNFLSYRLLLHNIYIIQNDFMIDINQSNNSYRPKINNEFVKYAILFLVFANVEFLLFPATMLNNYRVISKQSDLARVLKESPIVVRDGCITVHKGRDKSCGSYNTIHII